MARVNSQLVSDSRGSSLPESCAQQYSEDWGDRMKIKIDTLSRCILIGLNNNRTKNMSEMKPT